MSESYSGRVIGDELRYDRDLGGNVREVTVAIPTDSFDEPGQQFGGGEKVIVTENPVEQAIETVREGDDG